MTLAAGFTATGGYIYYNTDVLNTHWSTGELETRAAETEKKYKKYQYAPQPKIVAVKANVDIHPERRAVFIDGSYLTVNKTGVPIRDVLVNWSWRKLTSFDLSIPNAKISFDDPGLGYRMYSSPSRRATCSASGPRTAAATFITRPPRRSRDSGRSCRRATR